MATDLNVVAVTGRLTRAAELKYSNGGMAFAKFSIAVNRRTKKGDQWVDDASFFDCTLFGKSAESLNSYLTKGQQVAINGSLVQERWEQDGQNRSRVCIIVNSLTLLGGKSESNEQAKPAQQSYKRSLVQQEYLSNQGDYPDDSIPF